MRFGWYGIELPLCGAKGYLFGSGGFPFTAELPKSVAGLFKFVPELSKSIVDLLKSVAGLSKAAPALDEDELYVPGCAPAPKQSL
jgi:hypothetical protein